MKCPVCRELLTRRRYENYGVFQCAGCFGYLLSFDRLAVIKRTCSRDLDELKEEAMREMAEDTLERVNCPQCLQKMRKKPLPAPASFHIDRCDGCELIWLDGGELALYQLHYQASPQGREAAEMRRRHDEMSPGRRQKVQGRLDSMPPTDSPLDGV